MHLVVVGWWVIYVVLSLSLPSPLLSPRTGCDAFLRRRGYLRVTLLSPAAEEELFIVGSNDDPQSE